MGALANDLRRLVVVLTWTDRTDADDIQWQCPNPRQGQAGPEIGKFWSVMPAQAGQADRSAFVHKEVLSSIIAMQTSK